MNRISLLAITILASCVLHGQEIAFPIKATLNAGSTKTFTFTVAADRQGTDSIDFDLGETEIPALPLPGDIFYVWTVAPTAEVIWLSPMEIRGYPAGEQSFQSYDLRVNWSGGVLDFTWGKTIPPQIDSMYIVDGFSDFPDNIQSVKVQPGGKFTTNNPAFDRFKVLVWYNGTTTSVSEELLLPQLSAYPNPTSHLVTIDGIRSTDSEIQIVGQQGQLIERMHVNGSSATIDLQKYSAGIYAVRVIDPTGVRYIPIIRR